jgi:hypothetical protein
MSQPVAAPPPPSAPPAKKGLGIWAWLGLGCLVLVLLGLGTCYACGMYAKKKLGDVASDLEKNPAMMAAELLVRANPEVELVSKDEAAGTLTIRKKATGETITVNISEIQQGKFSFTDEKGETSSVSLGAVAEAVGVAEAPSGEKSRGMPDWIPVAPGAQVRQLLSTTGGEGRSGTYILSSIDTLDAVGDFYERRFTAAGFETKRSSGAVGGAMSGTSISAESKDGRQTVNIGLTDMGGKTQALITFSDKN